MSLSVKIPTNEPSFTTRTDPARPVDIARAACVTLTAGSTVISSVLMSSRTVVTPPVTILVSDESAFIPIMPVKSRGRGVIETGFRSPQASGPNRASSLAGTASQLAR